MKAVLQTKRLLLRPWRPEDFKPFAEMNADPRVMEFFPSILSQKESDDQAKMIQTHIDQHGWGFWAVSLPNEADFIGFIGLKHVSFIAHFTPAVEIGWRLATPFWGKGYAAEGALACLEYAFHTLQLKEVVSYAAVANVRSRRVMEKIHMRYEDNFYHPAFSKEHFLQPFALYRVRKD